MNDRRDPLAGMNRELLDLLVCPVDRGELALEGSELVCRSCGRRYPVIDGIPNLLVQDE